MMMWPRTMLLGSTRVTGRAAAQRPWGVHTGGLCVPRAGTQRPTSVVGLVKRVGATQFYATSSKDQPPESGSSGLLDRVVDRLNASIKKYPGDTIVTLFAFDIGSIAAMYGLLSVSGTSAEEPFLCQLHSRLRSLQASSSRPNSRWPLPRVVRSVVSVCR